MQLLFYRSSASAAWGYVAVGEADSRLEIEAVDADAAMLAKPIPAWRSVRGRKVDWTEDKVRELANKMWEFLPDSVKSFIARDGMKGGPIA